MKHELESGLTDTAVLTAGGGTAETTMLGSDAAGRQYRPSMLACMRDNSLHVIGVAVLGPGITGRPPLAWLSGILSEALLAHGDAEALVP